MPARKGRLAASAALLEDLVAGNRILAMHGVLDACGRVRGHGMTVVGENLPEAVFRSIYTDVNAKLQMNAARLEGPLVFLSDAEGRRSTESNRPTIERPWEQWKKKALARK